MNKTLNERHKFGGFAAVVYRRYIRTVVKNNVHRQRLKMLYDVWWYLPLLRSSALPFHRRVRLILKALRIDWNVLIGSKPAEVVPVMLDLMSRPARANEIFIEAGCWNGGSTAKFSLVCRDLGYKLHVFDSFQGVKEWNYLFAAGQEGVEKNIRAYGDIDVCTFHPGWFKDTLAKHPVSQPVRMVYIDCDVPIGTKEALTGVLPSLVSDGVVYTQDYHLDDVKEVLNDVETWNELRVPRPTIRHVIRNLARLTWASSGGAAEASRAH
jgi:O-methyltransferase